MPALQSSYFCPAAQCQLLIVEEPEQLHDIDFTQPFCAGEGSNTIFTAPYQGSVVLIANKGLVIEEHNDAWLLHCEAGENWHQLVQQSQLLAMPGLENLALIPGPWAQHLWESLGPMVLNWQNL